MGYIGKVPADVLIDPHVDSAAITDGTIVTADIANDAVTSAKLAANSVDSSELIDGSVDNSHLAGSIAINKTLLAGGTGLTLSTNTLNVDAAQTQITSVGTLTSLTSSGTISSSTSSTTDSALTLTDAGVADYKFTFPDTSTIRLSTSTSSTKVFDLSNAGSGKMKLSVDGGLRPITGSDYSLVLESTNELNFYNADGYADSNRATLHINYSGTGSAVDLANSELVVTKGTGSTFAGVVTASGSTGSNYIGSFTNTSATGWGLFLKAGADNADYTLRVQNKDAGDLLSVKSGGRIGIGTNDPGYLTELRVNDTTVDTPRFVIRQLGTGDASLGFQVPDSPYGWVMGCDTSSDECFVLGTGVGNLASAKKFQVNTDGFVTINDNDSGSAGSALKQLSLGKSDSTYWNTTNTGTFTGLAISNSHGDAGTGTGIQFSHGASSSGISYIVSRSERATSSGGDRSSLHFGTRGSDGVARRLVIGDDGTATFSNNINVRATKLIGEHATNNRRLQLQGSGDGYMLVGAYDDNEWGYIENVSLNNGMYFNVSNGAFNFDTGHIRPYTDNEISLGESNARFVNCQLINNPNVTSDKRRKDNIKKSSLGLEFLNKLNPVQYKWKDYETKKRAKPEEDKEFTDEIIKKTYKKTHYGLIAQEVEKVVADSGMTNDDFAPLVYDKETDTYGMMYGEYVGILIKAVQELSAKVQELENK